MDKTNLIEYLRVIKETETGIYSANMLLDKLHLMYSSLQKPSAPVKPTEPGNIKVNALSYMKTRERVLTSIGLCYGSIGSIGFVVLLILSLVWKYIIPGLFVCAAFVCLLFFSIRKLKKTKASVKASIMQDYQEQLNLYNMKQKAYIQEYNKYQKTYDEAKAASEKIGALIKDDIKNLTENLSKLYGLGIIYPKYHDWVSVCSFLEYLESGRCECLDGSNGAYNIYESEKRQNMIISELSKIGDDLNAIRANQYELYTAMTSANSSISDILVDMKNQQAISIYENRLNAQIIAASNYLSKL